ncbi:3'-5' exonuclease [Puniceibacterium confluentis]|uniref:3'-5' exonuclease n=1 Tax=Puniceibacterium confluentis TaxID=1958944 RepID=UPI0011B3BA98|nr:3'-5' exonuclease [Puniceibacterium confluentis]
MVTHRDGLRFRIFLIFAALALALVGGLQAVLWFGAAKAAETSVETGLALTGLAGTGLILALSVAAWIYLDEHIAKPLEHPPTAPPQSGETDLSEPCRPVQETAAQHETRRLTGRLAELEAEKLQLTRVLREVPVAILMINAADRILLYDSQAAELLSRSGPPRLNAPLSDYFNPDLIAGARARMQRTGLEVRFAAVPGAVGTRIDARMRPLEDGGALVVLDEAAPRADSPVPGPLVYDFDLIAAQTPVRAEDIPLNALTFVVLSTETTGLLPHRDEVLRIGAVRMVGSSILRREVLDLRIGATGHDDASGRGMRAGTAPEARPTILTAIEQFHTFATDAVIVAHNAPLRMAFLRRHDASTGLVWDLPQIDLVLLSALLFGDGADHSLRALAGRTGVTLPAAPARGGLSQALMAAEVMQRLMPLLTGHGLESLGHLVEALQRHADRLERLH